MGPDVAPQRVVCPSRMAAVFVVVIPVLRGGIPLALGRQLDLQGEKTPPLVGIAEGDDPSPLFAGAYETGIGCIIDQGLEAVGRADSAHLEKASVGRMQAHVVPIAPEVSIMLSIRVEPVPFRRIPPIIVVKGRIQHLCDVNIRGLLGR
eukprot:4604756-Prorocentrum_lima.AAC.1